MKSKTKQQPEKWAVNAAVELDQTIGDIVSKNTGLDVGFFAGISINDMAAIIIKHEQAKQKTK